MWTAITESVYRRMEAERKRVANELRSTGWRPKAKRSAPMPIASARSRLPMPTAMPRRSRARATPRPPRIYAESFGRDPQFAQFYRSLEAYKASFNKKSDVMVVDRRRSDFFKAMRGGGPATAPAAKK